MADADLDEAFAAVPRAEFLPASARWSAHVDAPVPIGHGATNSQPWTVRYMLRHLDVRPGHRVLDVGSGSGWTTALLGYLVGEEGSVVGVEIVPELVALGRAHLANRFAWARIEQAVAGTLGWPKGQPYDGILVSASGRDVPPALVDQLAPQGRLVLPVGHEMVVVTKDAAGATTVRTTGERFNFVPLQP